MASGVVMVAGDGTIRLFNLGMRELFGLDPSEVAIGMPLGRHLGHIASRRGWTDEQLREAIASHGAWMSRRTVTRVAHAFDEDMTLDVACCPTRGGGAVLIYRRSRDKGQPQ